MKHLLVVIVALLVPATAMAKGECKEDVLKFCKDAEHIATCLDEHEAELSEACKTKREAKTNEKKNEESAKMGKEEGTHTGPSQGATPENDTQKIDQPARKNIPSNEQTKP
jgi:hypothetical protein